MKTSVLATILAAWLLLPAVAFSEDSENGSVVADIEQVEAEAEIDVIEPAAQADDDLPEVADPTDSSPGADDQVSEGELIDDAVVEAEALTDQAPATEEELLDEILHEQDETTDQAQLAEDDMLAAAEEDLIDEALTDEDEWLEEDFPIEGDTDPTTPDETEIVSAFDDSPAMSLTLLVHPVFTPDQAELVYRPLINYLNSATRHEFELVTPRDFHRYWLDTRRGEALPDLTLEDAHMVAYRMSRFGFTPLAKPEQPATFSLMTSDLREEQRLEFFVGRRVSSMPAPSLGYLVLASWYDNPMAQPVFFSNASSWLDAVEIVFNLEADAAIVPHNLVDRYVNLDIVATSPEFPGTTVAASPNVPESVREEITDALVALQDDPEYYDALFEMDIDRFVPADPDDYEGLESWLELMFSLY